MRTAFILRILVLGLSALALSQAVLAADGQLKISGKKVVSPKPGIICDRFVCSDATGLSLGLTQAYLGTKAANHLTEMSKSIEMDEFTLANGVFCSAKTKTCHVNRYYDPKTGKRSKIAKKETRILFGQ